MKDKGQVFTTDMIFALLLTAAFISVSGQAYAIATGNIRSYSARYSLERIVNDTTDVLVNTPGKPTNWETQPENLETLGLIKVGAENEPLRNYLDSRKLSRLASEISGDNWNPTKEKQDQAIMEFFGLGDFVDNFEIKVMENGETLWTLWPGKEFGENSPAESALEVATVNRIVFGSLVYIAAESPPLIRAGGAEHDNLRFWVYPGELKSYDWYLYIENLVEPQANWEVKAWINSVEGETSFHYKIKDMPKIVPDTLTGIENDDTIGDEYQLSEGESNFISVKITGVPEESLKIYVVALTSGTNRDQISKLLKERPFTLQVRLWR